MPIKWLGFDWGDREYYASDYFPKLYELALRLIREGKAYVDDQTSEQIAAQKGTPTTPGVESPFRNRSVEENLDLFQRMNAGEFEEGSRVLRAKIDMAHSNMHFRDPIMYRIIKTPHHRTGDRWKVYPMYDFAHGQSDYFEGVTHSICTLEFEVHRPLYEYFLRELADESYCPRQIEFNRLNLTYTVMSKRKLLQLVKEGLVNGWDDPRMPTICGLRRRGYTPASVRNFAETVGIAKRDNIIDVSLLEFCAREDLNKVATRTMAVLDPVKLVIDNFPDDKVEMLNAVNNPENPDAGTRPVPFTKELWIERADFREVADKKFYRLTIGGEVRLKYGYIVKCSHVDKDADGNITAIHVTYDPETKSGMPQSNRKVKATIHWVSVAHAKKAEVRLFERLFTAPDPDDCEEGKTFIDYLNPNSLTIQDGWIEEGLTLENAEKHYQFERIGYFCIDKDSTPDRIVFNKTVSLKQ